MLGLFLQLASGNMEAVLVSITENSWGNRFRASILNDNRILGDVGGVCALQSGNVVGRERALKPDHTV